MAIEVSGRVPAERWPRERGACAAAQPGLTPTMSATAAMIIAGGDEHARADRLAHERPAEEDRDRGVHERVRRDERRLRVAQQPDVGGEADERAEHDEVAEREQRAGGDVLDGGGLAGAERRDARTSRRRRSSPSRRRRAGGSAARRGGRRSSRRPTRSSRASTAIVPSVSTWPAPNGLASSAAPARPISRPSCTGPRQPLARSRCGRRSPSRAAPWRRSSDATPVESRALGPRDAAVADEQERAADDRGRAPLPPAGPVAGAVALADRPGVQQQARDRGSGPPA